MSNFKKVKKEILIENEDGMVCNIENIPSGMFEFFIHKRRKFKDGTYSWAIGVSPRADDFRSFVFDIIRGTRKDAEARLDEIIREEKERDEEEEKGAER